MLVLMVLSATLTFVCVDCASAATTRFVGPGDSIQDAVHSADPGDIIIVRDGIYTENVNVDVDNVTIRSENGSENCFVHASNPNDHVIEVTADSVTICGFSVNGATEYQRDGIRLLNVEDCNLSDNKVTDNYNGIVLEYSSNNTVTGNNVSTNAWFGLFLKFSCNNNVISNNTANSNDIDGIRIEESRCNWLTNNTVSNNGYHGIWLRKSPYNTLSSNCMNNNFFFNIQSVAHSEPGMEKHQFVCG